MVLGIGSNYDRLTEFNRKDGKGMLDDYMNGLVRELSNDKDIFWVSTTDFLMNSDDVTLAGSGLSSGRFTLNCRT